MNVVVVAWVIAVANAAELKLTWSDCGDSSTHIQITAFTPATVTTGQKTTMTGTGNLDEDVSAASFDLEMKTAVSTVTCKGDASASKTCNLPLGTGSLTFDALIFPLKKGSTSVSVDLMLSAALPGALAHTDTTVTAKTPSGDTLFCMNIKSAPASLADFMDSFDFERFAADSNGTIAGEDYYSGSDDCSGYGTPVSHDILKCEENTRNLSRSWKCVNGGKNVATYMYNSKDCSGQGFVVATMAANVCENRTYKDGAGHWSFNSYKWHCPVENSNEYTMV